MRELYLYDTKGMGQKTPKIITLLDFFSIKTPPKTKCKPNSKPLCSYLHVALSY